MKLYTHVTATHVEMARRFLLPSASEFDVNMGTSKQAGQGSFGSRGWWDNVKAKARTMWRAVRDKPGDIIVWADADVQFFGPVKDRLVALLGDADIASQREPGGAPCTGFYVARCNAHTRRLFELP